MQFRVAEPEGASPVRPADLRVQPRRHVRRGPHPTRVEDIPRRVLRNRRVFGLQGVRFVQDRGRKSDAHESGSGSHRMDFAGEAGLVALIHTDIERPFPKRDQPPVMALQTKELFKRHRKTKIIWAHVGLGRIVHPVAKQAEIISNAPLRIRTSNTSISTFPGTKSRSTRSSRQRAPSG